MNELIKINYESDRPTVLARDLHEFLEVKTAYKDWFPRMCEYGFAAGEDFNLLKNERVQIEGSRTVSRTVDDAQLTIDMAKEICMLQRNEKGKQARQYFLQIEKAWNDPDMIMARALKFAEGKLRLAEAKISGLQSELDVAQPKADFYDTFVSPNKCTGLRDTAKELGISERKFVNFLIDEKYLYRTPAQQLRPYAKKSNEGLFETKDWYTKSDIVKIRVFFTPQGKQFFNKKLVEKGFIGAPMVCA